MSALFVTMSGVSTAQSASPYLPYLRMGPFKNPAANDVPGCSARSDARQSKPCAVLSPVLGYLTSCFRTLAKERK